MANEVNWTIARAYEVRPEREEEEEEKKERRFVK